MGRDDIENIDIEAADEIRFDISISKQYIDIFDLLTHHYIVCVSALNIVRTKLI